MTNASENQDGDLEGADTVAGILAGAPSAPFVLSKFLPDGTKKDFHLRIQLATPEEELGCLQRAQATAKKYGESGKSEYGDIYREAQCHEIIAKVLKHDKAKALAGTGADYYPQVFVNAEQLRKAFTANEISLCLNALEVTKAKFAHVQNFDPDELDTWAARLSDTLLGPFFLSRLDSSQWPALLTALSLEVQALRAEVSRPLPTLRASSESASETSDTGTGGSPSSDSESLSTPDGIPIRSDRQLTRDEALEIAKKRRDEPDKS